MEETCYFGLKGIWDLGINDMKIFKFIMRDRLWKWIQLALEEFAQSVAILTELSPMKFESYLLRCWKGRRVSFV
jgi:hypothetical protein